MVSGLAGDVFDQVFVMKQISEKFVHRNKSLYGAYMDLEKAYDRVNREAMWHIMGMYGINGQLLKAVQSLYKRVMHVPEYV